MKVWLDDERPAPDGWVHARTTLEAIALFNTGNVTEMSLDHDLGDTDLGRNGYDVLVHIEFCAHDGCHVPPILHVHTANPPARKRMEAAVRAIQAAADHIA